MNTIDISFEMKEMVSTQNFEHLVHREDCPIIRDLSVNAANSRQNKERRRTRIFPLSPKAGSQRSCLVFQTCSQRSFLQN